jgi:hypothetical protein
VPGDGRRVFPVHRLAEALGRVEAHQVVGGPSPIASRPSCARLHRLPAHPHRAPSPAGVGRRPRQRPLAVTPRTLTAARWSPYSARSRRAASSPRPEASPGTAAPPSARSGLHSGGEAGDCGRWGDGDGSARRGRGLEAPHPHCPSMARRPSSPRATATTATAGRVALERWASTAPGTAGRGDARWGAGRGPRPMSYVAT